MTDKTPIKSDSNAAKDFNEIAVPKDIAGFIGYAIKFPTTAFHVMARRLGLGS